MKRRLKFRKGPGHWPHTTRYTLSIRLAGVTHYSSMEVSDHMVLQHSHDPHDREEAQRRLIVEVVDRLRHQLIHHIADKLLPLETILNDLRLQAPHP